MVDTSTQEGNDGERGNHEEDLCDIVRTQTIAVQTEEIEDVRQLKEEMEKLKEENDRLKHRNHHLTLQIEELELTERSFRNNDTKVFVLYCII